MGGGDFPCLFSLAHYTRDAPVSASNPPAPLCELIRLNLETAVAREKAVQAVDVHRKYINCMVTFWVMSQF
jgi:hypothetical protein